MLARTWPYGSQKSVTVHSNKDNVLMLLDPVGREGYTLLGTEHPWLHAGETCTIEFTKGGPTGGYWKVVTPPPIPKANEQS